MRAQAIKLKYGLGGLFEQYERRGVMRYAEVSAVVHQDAEPKSMLEVPYSECRQALTAVHAPQAYKGSMTPTAPERAMRTPKPAVSLEAPTSVPEGSAEQAEGGTKTVVKYKKPTRRLIFRVAAFPTLIHLCVDSRQLTVLHPTHPACAQESHRVCRM